MEQTAWILAILALFTIVMALYSIITKERTVAILAAGTKELFASVIFIILAAPDVAITEASIGAGLTTFIFFFALKKIKENK